MHIKASEFNRTEVNAFISLLVLRQCDQAPLWAVES